MFLEGLLEHLHCQDKPVAFLMEPFYNLLLELVVLEVVVGLWKVYNLCFLQRRRTKGKKAKDHQSYTPSE
ncbi:hypothetical protein THERU_03805 [Thermocrinis ruber]|uniref:Uncharacterized protein n=1 Tax=Thermocrinis ruber TaxID=75906 RepID=W0DHU0_9AQUI|nr:hypothetical protein THERU_03805 [Thermocrinis ruber]